MKFLSAAAFVSTLFLCGATAHAQDVDHDNEEPAIVQARFISYEECEERGGRPILLQNEQWSLVVCKGVLTWYGWALIDAIDISM